MTASLHALVEMPHAQPEVARLLAELQGPHLVALVEATSDIGDTRFSPLLAALLTRPTIKTSALLLEKRL